MTTIFYILPNQIFYTTLPKVDKIVLWEHPVFFTKYKFNKKKLILHRASMKCYYDHLLKKHSNVEYIPFYQLHNVKNGAKLFDPINRIKDFDKCDIFESPNFLVSRNDLKHIYDKKKSKTSMQFTNYFYPRIKKIINYLEEIKSIFYEI